MARRKIAIIGARGIANYGGFETLVAELAPRLHKLGFEVYCSHRMRDGRAPSCDPGGVNVLYFPFRFPRSSRLGRIFEILYDGYFSFKCAFVLKCDAVYCLGTLSGLMLFGLRLSGAAVVLNIDGVEWRRQKFNFVERGFVKVSFLASSMSADRLVIDNRRLAGYVHHKYSDKAVFIPYGVNEIERSEWNPSIVRPFIVDGGDQIEPGNYWLVVARLEPDNNIHVILEAYLRSSSERPLVVVGGFSSPAYEKRILGLLASRRRGQRVILTGPIFDRKALNMLRSHCLAYLHGHSVGGTNPSLLEAMGAGNLIVAHDNPFNREVCGTSAFYFDSVSGLSSTIDGVASGQLEHDTMRRDARSRALSEYQWDRVAALYAEMFDGL